MRTAIVGLGPVALLTSSLLRQAGVDFYFLSRSSERSHHVARLLQSPDGLPVRQTFGATFSLPPLRGEVRQSPEEQTESTILCVPNTEFVSAFRALQSADIKEIVLMNSGLGCTSELAACGVRPTVFSNFFAAAKLSGSELLWKALKRKIFLGGSGKLSTLLARALETLGVEVATTSPLQAEFRNITLYAHAVFGLAPHTLERVFGLVDHPRYLYKLYPEGPLERRRTLVYAGFFQDVMRIAQDLGEAPFNLLRFLHTDNYPVSEQFLNDDEVESFPDLALERQGDLLFARYTGLLVDPTSKPDAQGRYFDFSAVPIQQARWQADTFQIPRVPSEDIYNLILLRTLGRELNLDLVWLDKLWNGLQQVLQKLEARERAAVESFMATSLERAQVVASAMHGGVKA